MRYINLRTLILVFLSKLKSNGSIYDNFNLNKTCPKSEYLEIDSQVLELSKNLLTEYEIIEANKLSKDLTSRKTRQQAIYILQNKIGNRPKRPIYYLNFELTHLPHITRDAIRYSGDYIDQLIKYCASEKKRVYLNHYH